LFESLAAWILAALAVAATALLRLYLQERAPGRVPVLLYHRLVEDALYPRLPRPENIFSIPESRFREQMDFLVRSGYSTLSCSELEQHLDGRTLLPPRPLLITFDDGSESVFSRALPILRDRGLKATVFVTTDTDSWVFHEHPRSQRRLAEQEMRQLETGGVAVESHGVSHRALNSMPEDNARDEMLGSKRFLDAVLGRSVSYFAIPLNYYSPRILEVARQAGYRLVFTSDNGTNRFGSDRRRLRRFIVEGNATLQEFARLLTPWGMVQRRVIADLKRLPPKLFGYRVWMPLRRLLYQSPLGLLLTPRHLRRLLLAVAVLLLAAAVFSLLASGGL